METILPSQPESNHSLLIRSLWLYRAGFKKIFFISLLLAITLFIPRIIWLFFSNNLITSLPKSNLSWIWLVCCALVSMLFFIAIVKHMHFSSQHIQEQISDDLRAGIRKTLSAYMAVVVQCLFIFAVAYLIYSMQVIFYKYHMMLMTNTLGVIFTMCVVFAQLLLIIYVGNLFYFIVPLIAIENLGILRALEKSILLVWNHWWRTFSLQIMPWLYYLLALLILNIFHINIHIYYGQHINPNYISVIINILLFSIFIPWVAAVMLIQLKDLELRRIAIHAKKAP